MRAPEPQPQPRPADDRAPDADEVDDDRPIGRVLKRREVLLLLGGAGAALAAVGAAEAAGFGPGRRRSPRSGQPPAGQVAGPGGPPAGRSAATPVAGAAAVSIA